MKILISDEQLNKVKSREKVAMQCEYCGSTFYKSKHDIHLAMWKRRKFEEGDFERGNKDAGDFCSSECLAAKMEKAKIVKCSNCEKEFKKTQAEICKSNNHFCSRSCAATYNNKHKKYGTRRSKLEVYLAEQIDKYYIELQCQYNCKETIESELDFYFPTLKLAIELNGIFHYEPIYGDDKLEKIQRNDYQKMLRCGEVGIELCIIDVSKCSYLTLKRKQEYWEIVNSIIQRVYARHTNSLEA